jgi:nicotinamidase-related amidase
MQSPVAWQTVPTAWEDHVSQLRALNDWLRIDPARTAVITVDMHRGHLDPNEATMPVRPEISERVLASAGRFLRFAREAGIPVIHAILSWRPDEVNRWNPRVDAGRLTMSRKAPTTRALAAGTPHNLLGSVQCKLMPEIGPEPGDRIVNSKKTLSIYYGTELDVLLNTFIHVDTIILMGINTNTCVQCAAFETANRAYHVVVLEDCVGSMYGEDMHTGALQNIARCLGWVLTTEEAMAKIRSGVGAASEAHH